MKQKNSDEDKQYHGVDSWTVAGYLGGDDAVVRVTLRDVGLSSRRGFFMPDVHRPTVHPVLLPHTLTEREREI